MVAERVGAGGLGRVRGSQYNWCQERWFDGSGYVLKYAAEYLGISKVVLELCHSVCVLNLECESVNIADCVVLQIMICWLMCVFDSCVL